MFAAKVMKIDLRDVEAVQDRVYEELLLVERPDGAFSLIWWALLDGALPAERLLDREVLR
jgi:hypothetical protein